jgi:Zn-dependent metalloprotease
MAENADEKSKQEEEIKNFCQNRAAKKLEKVAKFLESVALDDKRRDIVSVKTRVNDPNGSFHYEYRECEIAIPINVRVTAAKTWKELIADKAIGDIKEKAKASKSEGLDMKKAMEAIAKAKAAEKAKADEDIPLE